MKRKEFYNLKRIALCVCTYKRVELLDELVSSLIKTRLDFFGNFQREEFDVQIIIVDNDSKKSAETKVKSFGKNHSFIHYYCEPQSGLVRARNKCLEISIKENYDYLTFIDDDEYVDISWLSQMYTCLEKANVNIVFGKVEVVYPPHCPDWIMRGGFFNKSDYPDGQRDIVSATANVLIDISMVKKEKEYFNLAFNTTGGEDTYFFKKYIKKGYRSIWCKTGVVYDRVVNERLHTKYIYLRAYTSSYTYSEIQQKLREESTVISFVKGAIKLIVSLSSYPFYLFSEKEKKVSTIRNLYSGLGRMKIKKLSRY